MILDCWSVFDWFNIHPDGREEEPSEALPARIFLVRIRMLDHLLKMGDAIRADEVRKKIMDDVASLPKESVSVRERLRDVELALSPKLWDRVGLDPLNFLKTKITPLMRYKPNVDLNEASFTLKIEQLSLALLVRNQAEIDRLREDIAVILRCLPVTITEVKQKEELIDRFSSKSFWQSITYSDAQAMLQGLGPLMKYKLPEPRPVIVLDIGDVVEQRELVEYGPPLTPLSDYVQNYMAKVEEKIKKLAEEHPTIQKITRGEVITEEDLQNLEMTLNSPDLYITEENLQKIYHQHKGTLVQFIKKILGLYQFPDPREKIEEAFRTFMVEKNYLNADQVNFLRTIQTVFTMKHHIEYSDLFEPPFTSFGPKAPLLLPKEDLTEVFSLCQNLEQEVFKSA